MQFHEKTVAKDTLSDRFHVIGQIIVSAHSRNCHDVPVATCVAVVAGQPYSPVACLVSRVAGVRQMRPLDHGVIPDLLGIT